MNAMTSERRRPYEALTRRWPTALAVALFLAGVSGGGSGDTAGAVGVNGQILMLLPMQYLIVTEIGRRRASWPVLGVLTATLVGIWTLDVVSATHVLVGIALVLLMWGGVSGTPHGRATFGVQAAGMLGFGALAVVGLAVDPDLGRYLVAAGWFCHGVWDYVHLRLDKVVSRTFAEWCGVLDVLIAAQLVFLL